MNAGGRVEVTEEPELNAAPGREEQEIQKAWSDAGHIAWLESKKRISRIRNGNTRAVGNGAALRKPKYGYQIGGNKRRKFWIIDDVKAKVVRGMYARAINGETLGAIAVWAVTADGGKWDASRVRKIITDTAYMGKAETKVNGEPYIYECPEIVSVETWQRANAAVKAPKRYVRAAVSPFAGIVRCGNCGTVMLRTSEGTGSRVGSGRYWRCPKQADGCKNVRYQEFSGRIHAALSGITAELFEEVIVKAEDMRQVRLTLLNDELAGIGRKGLSPADMIARITQISAEMEAVRAERAPRGHIERKGSGVIVGEAYKALDHDDPESVNAWLKARNVRVWCGGDAAAIAVRESIPGGEAHQAAYTEPGMVITWWLTGE
jgi:hypothetical protein